ncbi:MAG: hypothetical protein IIC39_05410 [Candidatus Marinimicrobia bacterium]|nr:hypothetical protein [Candidatus Neomarinimicrobiota bacterium]
MGPISGFTVALPFLIVILVFMVKQLELDHLRKKTKAELTLLSKLFTEALKSDSKANLESVQSYFIDGLRKLKEDGDLSETTYEIIGAGILKPTKETK